MPRVTEREQLEAYVRHEVRRRVKPALLRLIENPHIGQDLPQVFLDILDSMIKKEST